MLPRRFSGMIPEREMNNSSFLSIRFISFCLLRAKTMHHDISSTTAVRIAVPRFDSTPEIPTFARMEVSAAKIAESTAYIIQGPFAECLSVFLFSTIKKIPAARIAVAMSLTARLLCSPKQIIASSTVKIVLDLSMGTTLLISPMESALK